MEGEDNGIEIRKVSNGFILYIKNSRECLVFKRPWELTSYINKLFEKDENELEDDDDLF